MKISPSVSWCPILLLFSWVSPGGAQTQQPSPATQADSAEQTPATAPQNPPAAPPQDQPATPAPAQPRTGIRQPPPPIPKVPDIRQPGETGWWVGASGWFPTQTPTIDKGKGAAFTTASLTKLQGKPKIAQGAEVGLALGLHNALRLSYFESRAAGNLTNPYDTQLWDHAYPKGGYVSTNYRIQNLKLSFEYLTWPYPVESRKFRLKTLWQLQYTGIRSVFDLPLLPLVDSTGLPLVDSTGNQLSYAGQGTRSLIYPTFGLAPSYYITRNFRIEANASGFAIPHHASIWDADASANFRFGHFELKVGAKGFHVKTSTQAQFFLRTTMASGIVGLRWYSN